MDAIWAVVVAGGRGTRFGGAKQFVELGGRSVAERSVEACRSVAGGVVLVIPAGSTAPGSGADVTVPGGATRSASVRAGLAVVPPEAEVVVVHDAARPLASPALFRAVVAALDDPTVSGAVCGLPVADTIKSVRHGLVTATLDRASLVAVQTPQAFRAGALRQAHADAADATDDAALVEATGGRVRVVDGDPVNIKITTPEDLGRAAELCQAIDAVGGTR